EKGIGIENRVSQILKCRSMELIRSGLRNDVHIRAWISPVAGVVRRGLNLKLLKGVWAGYSNSGIKARIAGGSTICEIGDVDSVHLEIILAGVIAIHRHVLGAFAERCGVVGRGVGAGRQGQNLRVVARAQGELRNSGSAYSGSKRGSGRLQHLCLG